MTTKKVLVYSTPTCPYCIYAKDFFTEKGVDFEDIDGQIIVGFQPEVFENILTKRNQ